MLIMVAVAVVITILIGFRSSLGRHKVVRNFFTLERLLILMVELIPLMQVLAIIVAVVIQICGNWIPRSSAHCRRLVVSVVAEGGVKVILGIIILIMRMLNLLEMKNLKSFILQEGRSALDPVLELPSPPCRWIIMNHGK